MRSEPKLDAGQPDRCRQSSSHAGRSAPQAAVSLREETAQLFKNEG